MNIPEEPDLDAANAALEIATRDTPKPTAPRKVIQMDTARILPQSPEAESAVLSSLLISPAESFAVCAEFNLDTPWFHIPTNGVIWEGIVFCLQHGKLPDFPNLAKHLRDKGQLDSVGGPSAISALFTYIPTAANIREHLEILHEKFALREGIKTATEYSNRFYEEQDDVPNLLDSFERDALAVRKVGIRTKAMSNTEASRKAMESIRWRAENPRKIRGTPTGFPRFDMLTDGLLDQQFIVVASRPGEGKTALAIQWAEHILFSMKLPVAFFSLEMAREEFLERWISMRARVDLSSWRQVGSTKGQLAACENAATELAIAPLRIEEGEAMTIQEFRAHARRLVRENKARVIFVDSGSQMKSNSKQASYKRDLEVADITGGFKAAAKELNIPIVVLWHLGRQMDKSKSDMPTLSDLRGGATVEQDADKVIMIIPGEDEPGQSKARLFAAKQRGGGERKAAVDVIFQKGLTSFHEVEYDQDSQAEMPI
jgi:replicative DNA helicase